MATLAFMFLAVIHFQGKLWKESEGGARRSSREDNKTVADATKL